MTHVEAEHAVESVRYQEQNEKQVGELVQAHKRAASKALDKERDLQAQISLMQKEIAGGIQCLHGCC